MSKEAPIVHKETRFENAATWLQLGIDFESRRIEYTGDVTDVMQSLFIRALIKMGEISRDPIEIYLSTGGGQATSGFAIYDAIRACPCHITIFGNGELCSAGTVIFLAGDTRVASENTRFMIHSAAGAVEGKVHDMAAYVAEAKITNTQMANVYAERTKIKNMDYWLKKFQLPDYFFGIQEANDLGLIKTPKPKPVVKKVLTKKSQNGKIKKSGKKQHVRRSKSSK